MIDIANHKSPVESFKGFGNSPPSLPNLYLVSPDFPVDDLWFGDEGVKSLSMIMQDPVNLSIGMRAMPSIECSVRLLP